MCIIRTRDYSPVRQCTNITLSSQYARISSVLPSAVRALTSPRHGVSTASPASISMMTRARLIFVARFVFIGCSGRFLPSSSSVVNEYKFVVIEFD